MGYKEQDTILLAINAMMRLNVGARAGRLAAPQRTKNSFIPYICIFGMAPGSSSYAPCYYMGVCKRTAVGRAWELRKMGYIWKDNDRKVYLTEDGHKVFDAVMKIFKPSLDELMRAIVRDAAKYRKEIELRRPEKGEIVLLEDGCPVDILTRQRKRKRKQPRTTGTG